MMKVIEQVGEKSYLATIGGSSAMVFGGLSVHETAIMVGMATAILGLVVQCVYLAVKSIGERQVRKAELELQDLQKEKLIRELEEV